MSASQPTETWRDIPGFLGYQASDWGRVQSFWAPGGRGKPFFVGTEPKLRIPRSDRKGYLRVNLRVKAGVIVTAKIHELVLIAFVGPKPPGMEARHLDDDKANNRLENLAWGTHSENMGDRFRNGYRALRGETHNWAKLTDADVRMIRELRAQGLLQREISGRLGIPQTTISRVLTGYSWSHVK
jgi:hypothetical protein